MNSVEFDDDNRKKRSQVNCDDIVEPIGADMDRFLSRDFFKKKTVKKTERFRGGWGNSSRNRESSVENYIMRDLVNFDYKPQELSQKLKFYKQYLEAVRLIYSELSKEFGHEFYLNNSDARFSLEMSNERVVNALYNIEVLVLNLYSGLTPAYIFDKEYIVCLDNESLQSVRKRITSTGYLLLSIFDSIGEIKKMKDSIYLSYNIKLFLSFMMEYSFKPKGINSNVDFLDEVVCFDTLNELNIILIKLNKVLDSGEFNPNLYSPVLGNFRGSVFSHKISHGLSSQVFQKLSKRYFDRLGKAINYFRGYKHKNFVLYKFRIGLECVGAEVTLEQCKMFFKEWNKRISKPEVGLDGYLNYFYFWWKHNGLWFQDIVILIDSDSLLSRISEEVCNRSIRSIYDELKIHLLEVLNHKKEMIFKDQQVPRLHLESISLMDHLNLPSQILIEKNNREAWSFFENKIVPFFMYHDFLQVDKNEEMIERFSKGTRKIN